MKSILENIAYAVAASVITTVLINRVEPLRQIVNGGNNVENS